MMDLGNVNTTIKHFKAWVGRAEICLMHFGNVNTTINTLSLGWTC